MVMCVLFEAYATLTKPTETKSLDVPCKKIRPVEVGVRDSKHLLQPATVGSPFQISMVIFLYST